MLLRKLLAALLPFSFLLLLLFEKDLAMVGDLGRHLKLGEIVLQCRCVPQTNLFSYTNPDFPIVNHEWLGEVFFYLVSVWFGVNGLLVFKMFLVLTSATLIYITASRKGSLFWVTIFSLLGAILFSMRFFVLPELYSYVFIGLFLFLIEQYKRTKKIVFLLPLVPLEVMWVNMHIYFILGIVMYGLFLLDEFLPVFSSRITFFSGRNSSRKSGAQILRQAQGKAFVLKKSNPLVKVLVIGIVVMLSPLLNPSFLRGALLPFTFSSNYGFPVEENMNPFTVLNPSTTTTNVAYTLYLEVFLFELLALVFVVSLCIKKQWKNVFQSGSGVTALVLGLKYTRCIGLFPLLGFVPLVQSFTRLEEALKKNMDAPMRNTIKGVIVLCVIIIVFIQIKGLMDYKIFGFGFVPSAEQAVAFIKNAGVEGRIFNNYIVGNYLIYGLYPKEQVYIDARPEAYPASFFNDYWAMMADAQFFDQQVSKYTINAVVFNVSMDDPAKIRPFLLRLLHGPDWVPVYADGTVTILVRNNNINQEVIQKYRIKLQ